LEVKNHILDERLPLNQNFEELKKTALNFIQKFGSSEWTNLNQSDPGVTILDQLCFAMTELGYCGEFPIEDLLTQSNGKINYDAQFYKPADILTTSPVTLDDYRKIIVDNFEEVINVLILPVAKRAQLGNLYDVYLSIDPYAFVGRKPGEKIDQIIHDVCLRVYIFLNSHRNVGEYFNLPQSFERERYILEGEIEIDAKDNFEIRVIELHSLLKEYIFSNVKQYGYEKLKQEGVKTNDLFNGPKMKNGWVHEDGLSAKRDKVNSLEIERMVTEMEGVVNHSNFNFLLMDEYRVAVPENRLNSISVPHHKLIRFEIIKSINEGYLKFYFKGLNLKDAFYPGKEMKSYLGVKIQDKLIELYEVSSVQLYPGLPKGEYREIDDYYSIQNTFPELYAVGLHAKKENASDFQKAQSRQLMGYLSLFDQVLANQFAQLGNLANLFTFKNSVAEDPLEKDMLNLNEIDRDKYFLKYPVEYLSFSPTYYFQSLYEVPNIRPILKHVESFAHKDEDHLSNQKEKESWQTYIKDPFNPYIKGLKEFMEDDRINIQRRNEILDHLLARHGESPMTIDAFVEGSEYTGNSQKDKVIYKSLYLQNLGFISYYRKKGYNIIGSSPIKTFKKSAIEKKLKRIVKINFTSDSHFNSPQIDKLHRLKEEDFINYSAIELKLNLLLGLSVQYLNFIKNGGNKEIEATVMDQQLRQAIWLLQARKGMIMFEANLLLRYAEFQEDSTVPSEDSTGVTKRILNFEELLGFPFGVQGAESIKKIMDSFQWRNKNDEVIWSDGDEFPDVFFFFPDYLPQFSTVAFKRRVELFLNENLPININYRAVYLSSEELAELIP